PDLRYGLEIVDVGDLVPQTDFKVFKDAIASGGKVRCINVKGGSERFSRNDVEKSLKDFVAGYKARGLAYVRVEADKLNQGIVKFLPESVQAALRQRLNAAAGDLLLFVADTEEVVCASLGALHAEVAARLKLVDPTKPDFKIAWVLDFPSY